MSDNDKIPAEPIAEVIAFDSANARKKKETSEEGTNLEEINKDNYLKTQEAARRRRAEVNARLRRDLKNGGGGRRW
jgi:hypothetical protein